MRILGLIRGHFALLTGRELETLPRGSKFVVERVLVAKESKARANWLIRIKPLRGDNYQSVYLSDILRAYTWAVTKRDWIPRREIEDVVLIGKAQSTYTMALVATFDDIESRSGTNAAIRYVEHSEIFGEPPRNGAND